MPIEVGLWRIDDTLKAIEFGQLDVEARLEDILDQDIAITSPTWMVIGRQVRTDYGMFIDLLAMDGDGNLVVLELKRDKTYRDIVAQVLDYGSWVRDLEDELRVTLAIEVDFDGDAPGDDVVRTVVENCNLLKFRDAGFEKE